jgi:hypothetical protein
MVTSCIFFIFPASRAATARSSLSSRFAVHRKDDPTRSHAVTKGQDIAKLERMREGTVLERLA